MVRKFSKHVPVRSCLSCRSKTAKGDLVRIVRNKAGSVQLDANGTKAGRGVYVCRCLGCWNAAFAGRRLEHSLRGKIHRADLDDLANAAGRLNLA